MPNPLAFRKDLESLINRHAMENGSNTPDFILAKYLADCLDAFDAAVYARTEWSAVDVSVRECSPPTGTETTEYVFGGQVKHSSPVMP